MRHWLVAISGGVASLTGWILQVYDKPTPAPYFLYGGYLVLLYAFIRAYHEVRTQRDELLRAGRTNLEIVFRPTNETDSRPYLQQHEFTRLVDVIAGVQQVHERYVERRYRVGIVNHSPNVIANVGVTLSSCRPEHDYAFLGFHLAVMGSDPPAQYHDVRPSRNGEPTAWFDVAYSVSYVDDPQDSFRFVYVDLNQRGVIDGVGPVEITLTAEGNDGSSHMRPFRLAIEDSPDHDEQVLTMKPL